MWEEDENTSYGTGVGALEGDSTSVNIGLPNDYAKNKESDFTVRVANSAEGKDKTPGLR